MNSSIRWSLSRQAWGNIQMPSPLHYASYFKFAKPNEIFKTINLVSIKLSVCMYIHNAFQNGFSFVNGIFLVSQVNVIGRYHAIKIIFKIMSLHHATIFFCSISVFPLNVNKITVVCLYVSSCIWMSVMVYRCLMKSHLWQLKNCTYRNRWV